LEHLEQVDQAAARQVETQTLELQILAGVAVEQIFKVGMINPVAMAGQVLLSYVI
jgi:hypothetical protein